jgi:hypothetical protein
MKIAICKAITVISPGVIPRFHGLLMKHFGIRLRRAITYTVFQRHIPGLSRPTRETAQRIGVTALQCMRNCGEIPEISKENNDVKVE